jgi:hypothetical protein
MTLMRSPRVASRRISAKQGIEPRLLEMLVVSQCASQAALFHHDE